MRIAYFLPALLLAACGSDPDTSASSATEGSAGSGSSGSTDPGPTSGPVTSGPSTDTPTSGSGSDSMTDGATTTTTTGDPTGDPTGDASGTTGDTSATEPVQTDTGPGETSTGTGPGETSTSTGPDDTGDTGDTGSSGDESSTGPGVEECACPDLEVALDDGIFVLSSSAELWKYFPETNMLTKLGAVGCDLFPSTFSMAVDRLGFAWVQYSGGQLRKVDVTNVAKCTDPGFVPNQQGINNFGMAFVSNSAFDKCDQLFGAQYNGMTEGNKIADFFHVDPMTQQIVKVGKVDFGSAEVTGTGDGRAFLFAPAALSKLVEVDKASGATISQIGLPGVQAGGGWAFAFFGGDFYFFTDGQSDGKSEVTHIDYDDSDNNGVQDIKVVIQNAPLKIVGAGVSTCAPTLPQ